MKRNKFILYTLSAIITLLTFGNAGAQEKESDFSLRKFFGLSLKTDTVFVNQYVDINSLQEWKTETEEFYKGRLYTTAWHDNDKMNRHGQELLKELKESWKNGIPEPVEYLSQIESSMLNMEKRYARSGSKAEAVSRTDLLMTQAYFYYVSALSSGLLNPSSLNVIWEVLPETINPAEHLEATLKQGTISESFKELVPKHKQYELLLNAFNQLTEVKSNGGWPLPGHIPVLNEGAEDSGVIKLKRYLKATGDLQTDDTSYIQSATFDNELTQAVKSFQQRHGLEVDGIPGESTLDQMNVPLEYRLDQIRLNIDRLRWLPEDFGENHIIINIPDYSFEYLVDNRVVQEMNVVVGQNENYTPVLKDTLYSIIFNPSWNVPNSIATEEIFPKMLEDSTFMERNKYSVLRESYVSEDTIEVRDFDWPEASRDSFPYFVVQHPGPQNSLGQIQFMLQNQYSIYLHDTPAHDLFDIAQRDFSHGCIRLEKPAELAMLLLEDQLPADTLTRYINEDDKQVVRLEDKVPVHIIYQTAWVEEDNMIHFRADVYEFDKQSISLLKRNFPEIASIKTSSK
jgi:L,D-transpeptidase YcbB